MPPVISSSFPSASIRSRTTSEFHRSLFHPPTPILRNRNHKSIHVAAVESTILPADIPLANGGEAFWLDDRTLAHAVAEGDDNDKVINLYAISVKVESAGSSSLSLPDPPVLIGKFPTDSATNFRYSLDAGTLVFSDLVHTDGDLNKVKQNDDAWKNRGDSAFVYDDTYERHWDKWVGPKRSSLFSVKLAKDINGKWELGTDFANLLKGTDHVSMQDIIEYSYAEDILQRCPVEPFGGTDDFDVSDTSVIYTAKDPKLPMAWHTKQNVRPPTVPTLICCRLIYCIDIHCRYSRVVCAQGAHFRKARCDTLTHLQHCWRQSRLDGT